LLTGLELLEGQGELAAALDDFDARVIMNPLTYDDAKMRPSLEEVKIPHFS
jgi:catenin alpha